MWRLRAKGGDTMSNPLFDAVPIEQVTPPRHKTMLRAYGKMDGKHCGGCVHLVRKDDFGGIWFKCDLTVQSDGPGTDWRKKWPACGKFDPKP